MTILNCVARWPGATHDARILRESELFTSMEAEPRPIQGLLLGDSGYMIREWLLTPILNPRDVHEETYTEAHCTTRSTIERCNGVLKRRWHCLHGEIRLEPRKVCRIIDVCVMLHNRAISRGLPPPEGDDPEPERNPIPPPDRADDAAPVVAERVRTAAEKACRNALIRNYF